MADTETDQMSEEERKMMSEWESMSGEGDATALPDMEMDEVPSVGGGDDATGTRILNQAEIDSLLGFDSDGSNEETSGVMALINAALINYERLPMLDIVFDRLVRLMSTFCAT